MSMTTGEATIRLLAHYGVETIFGIPGVHTLDFCRGLGTGSPVRHIQCRHEQGAGFMADGYARATGLPGVALVISGPGVTNAATALGQAYADSIPMLLISAEAHSRSLGKGWGVLHEVTDLVAVSRPLTALSARATCPEDVPELIGQAFSIFASQRPRPVHIAIPVDVLAQMTDGDWAPVIPPDRPQPDQARVQEAARMLCSARSPAIIVGGGAAGADVTALAERLGAFVLSTYAGKGIVPSTHQLCLETVMIRKDGHAWLDRADVILAIGTELSETDHLVEALELKAPLIRVDIDPRKMNDRHPAAVPIVGDAGSTVALLLEALGTGTPAPGGMAVAVDARPGLLDNLTESEAQHVRMLANLRAALPEDAIMMGDACQQVYTGAFAMPVSQPRLWHYPSGYCTLGSALPMAIGAKTALPDRAVVALAGDGGFMFTVQDLITAAELELPLPIILWENGGLKQIRDDMRASNVPRVSVDGINPDFHALATAMRCDIVEPDSGEAFQRTVNDALLAPRPTLILVHEGDDWLL